MRKFFDFVETTMLTIYGITLIGVMLFEHMLLKAGGSKNK